MEDEEDDDAAASVEFAQQIDFLMAMYSPEELVCVKNGMNVELELEIKLERIMVVLRCVAGKGFPATASPQFEVVRSRGIVDEEEEALLRRITEEVAANKRDTGQFNLVGPLLTASEVLREQNDRGGACCVCLMPISLEDSQFKANCWHIFHEACFLAWWHQVEAKRRKEGGEFSRVTRSRDQELSAISARVQERQDIVDSQMRNIENLKVEKKRLKEFLETWADESGDAENPEQLTASQARRRIKMICETIANSKEEILNARSKLKKLQDEKDALKQEIEQQNLEDCKVGIFCPMCQNLIAFEEFQHIIANVNLDGAWLPPEWTCATSVSQSKVALDLPSEVIARLESERAKRKQLFKEQLERGAIIEREASSVSSNFDGART